MLNIDSRIITELTPSIGMDAVFVLLAVSTHMNAKERTCYPSNERLQKMTGMGRDRIERALRVLKDKEILGIQHLKDDKGKFVKRIISVKTEMIGIFVAHAEKQSPSPCTENQGTGNYPYPENQSLKTSPWNPHPEIQGNNVLGKKVLGKKVLVSESNAQKNSETEKTEKHQLAKGQDLPPGQLTRTSIHNAGKSPQEIADAALEKLQAFYAEPKRRGDTMNRARFAGDFDAALLSFWSHYSDNLRMMEDLANGIGLSRLEKWLVDEGRRSRRATLPAKSPSQKSAKDYSGEWGKLKNYDPTKYTEPWK